MPVLTYEPVYKTHEYHGHTLEQVAHHIEQQAEAGLTHWVTRWHVMERNHDHTIARAEVEVWLEITLPHWAEYASATPAEQAEWDRFLQALQAHEDGHVEIVRQYTENADVMLEGLNDHDAAKAWKDNQDALNHATAHYDAGNDHGRNAGTTIELPDADAVTP
jgi:predicted secreted Zn-dependent protease